MSAMTRHIGFTLCALSIVGAGALLGCDFEDSFGFSSVENSCGNDADCNGAFCRADGHCEASTISPIEIAFEVTYDTGTNQQITGWQLPPQSFSGSGAVTLDVPEPALITGSVRMGQSPVPARVTVRGPVVVPGVAPILAQGTTVVDSPNASYTLAYPRGRSVRVRVEPTSVPASAPSYLKVYQASTVLPPLETEVMLDGDTTVDFDYPSDIFSVPCSAARHFNCSLTLTFSPTAASPNGADGSPPTLDALSVLLVTGDDTVISSYGRIEKGHVTLRVGKPFVAPGASEPPIYVLVGPSAERADFPAIPVEGVPASRPDFPTIHVGPVDLATVSDISVPVFPTFTYIASVENANSLPLGGAIVRFTARFLQDYDADVDHDRVVVAANAGPGATPGRFQVQLFAGTYAVLVTPSRLVDGGLLTDEIIVAPPVVGGTTLTGQIFKTPAVNTLNGSVVSLGSVNAPYVSVAAVPYPTSSSRAASGLTDSSGAFSFSIDPGDYDVVVEPFAESYFATQVIPLTSDLAAAPFVVALSAPIFVSGTVTMSGVPRTAHVNAYRVLRGIVDRSVLVASEDASNASFEMLFAP